jgi:hypothetical protein
LVFHSRRRRHGTAQQGRHIIVVVAAEGRPRRLALSDTQRHHCLLHPRLVWAFAPANAQRIQSDGRCSLDHQSLARWRVARPGVHPESRSEEAQSKPESKQDGTGLDWTGLDWTGPGWQSERGANAQTRRATALLGGPNLFPGASHLTAVHSAGSPAPRLLGHAWRRKTGRRGE